MKKILCLGISIIAWMGAVSLIFNGTQSEMLPNDTSAFAIPATSEMFNETTDSVEIIDNSMSTQNSARRLDIPYEKGGRATASAGLNDIDIIENNNFDFLNTELHDFSNAWFEVTKIEDNDIEGHAIVRAYRNNNDPRLWYLHLSSNIRAKLDSERGLENFAFSLKHNMQDAAVISSWKPSGTIVATDTNFVVDASTKGVESNFSLFQEGDTLIGFAMPTEYFLEFSANNPIVDGSSQALDAVVFYFFDEIDNIQKDQFQWTWDYYWNW